MIALFFDTETTGIPREDFTPEIVQIAAIVQDTETRRILHELSLIVTPTGVIPDEVANLHGITTEFAREVGISQADAHGMFVELIERSEMIVAHNITFDMEMLEINWHGAWIKATEREAFDTMRELTPIMKLPKTGENHFHDSQNPEYKAPRLQEAYEYFFGKRFDGAHDAMVDVRACRDVYFAMHDHRQSNA